MQSRPQNVLTLADHHRKDQMQRDRQQQAEEPEQDRHQVQEAKTAVAEATKHLNSPFVLG